MRRYFSVQIEVWFYFYLLQVQSPFVSTDYLCKQFCLVSFSDFKTLFLPLVVFLNSVLLEQGDLFSIWWSDDWHNPISF